MPDDTGTLPGGVKVRRPPRSQKAVVAGWFHLRERHDRGAAERYFRAAIDHDPDHAGGHFALAWTLSERGRLAEAFIALREAIRLDAEHPGGWEAMGRLHFLLGYYGMDRPYLAGPPAAGQTVFVHADDQLGIGDVVQELRYAVHLHDQGVRVLLACRRSLHALAATCPGVAEVLPAGCPMPPCDAHVALRLLPVLLGSIPPPVPYLAAELARVERWRGELAGYQGLKVGINWHGNAYRPHGLDPRAVPLAEFAPLARLDGVTLFALQQRAGREQLAGARFPVVDLGARLDHDGNAFMDTAAVLTCLDLLVTSDTAIAHVAGALGVPVCLLLTEYACARWASYGGRRRLYRTVTTYWVEEHGTWPRLFGAVCEEVGRLCVVPRERPAADE